MRVIIAGSRDGISYADVHAGMMAFVADHGGDPRKVVTQVISGTARGADRLGERWARLYRIPIRRMPADWELYGKRAGYLRNVQMAECADALVAFWDGQSRGTKHMIDIARRKGLLVKVYIIQHA